MSSGARRSSSPGTGHNVAAAHAAATLMTLREEIAAEAGEPFSLAEILALRDEGPRT